MYISLVIVEDSDEDIDDMTTHPSLTGGGQIELVNNWSVSQLLSLLLSHFLGTIVVLQFLQIAKLHIPQSGGDPTKKINI